MDLAFSLRIVQGPARKNGNQIVPNKAGKHWSQGGEKGTLLVVDAVHDGTSVDKVNEGLISNSRTAIGDRPELNTRDLN